MTLISDKHRLEKATEKDADDFARVLTAAFLPSAIVHLEEPDVSQWRCRFVNALKEVWDQPKARVYKAIDTTTSEIIGCAVWAALEGDEKRGSGASQIMDAIPGHFEMLFLPTTATLQRQALEDRVRYELGSRQLRWIAGKACQYLAIVGVLPQRQGQNVGESLIRVGMDEANQRQVACYLEATPAGFPVYERLGWNQVDSNIDIDLSQYGGPYSGYGVFRYRCMLKLPDMRR